MTLPRVSVIIPFFNTELFLQETIDSVFAQSFESWELLLVDDGSTDHSTAIAQECVRQHPDKVKYLEHPEHENRGPSASRNLGIANARGEFLAFLDADDIWLPEKLAEQVRILDEHLRAAMMYGLSKWWYSWNKSSADQQSDFTYSPGVSPNKEYPPKTLFSAYFINQKAVIPNPSSILVRRENALRVGGFEDSFRGWYEDQVFVAKMCLDTTVFVSDTCWDLYRQHSSSISAVAERRREEVEARVTFLNWLANYITQQELRGRIPWGFLQSQLWWYRFLMVLSNLDLNQRGIRMKSKKQGTELTRGSIFTSARNWLLKRWQAEDRRDLR